MTRHSLSLRPAALLLAAAVIASCLAACGSSSREDATGTSTQSGKPSTSADPFSHEDIMFAQMMIPHHEQAIEMCDLALKNSENTRIKGLAERIKATQRSEITTMRGWVAASGMGDSHSADAHAAMQGLLSEKEMAALAAAKGMEFDRLFLKGMVKHHEGAMDMASNVTESENGTVSDFANWLVSIQYNEVTEMNVLYSQIPAN